MSKENSAVDSDKRQRFWVTLLAVLVLLMAPWGWFAYQWNIVHERLAMLNQIRANGGVTYGDSDTAIPAGTPLNPWFERFGRPATAPPPPWYRGMFGDVTVAAIGVPASMTTPEQIAEIKRRFPEAAVPP